MERKHDKRKPDDPEQSRRFKETAVEVEAMDDESALDDAFSAIIKHAHKHTTDDKESDQRG